MGAAGAGLVLQWDEDPTRLHGQATVTSSGTGTAAMRWHCSQHWERTVLGTTSGGTSCTAEPGPAATSREFPSSTDPQAGVSRNGLKSLGFGVGARSCKPPGSADFLPPILTKVVLSFPESSKKKKKHNPKPIFFISVFAPTGSTPESVNYTQECENRAASPNAHPTRTSRSRWPFHT